MFKRSRFLVMVLLIVLSLSVGHPTYAQGPGGPWASGIACVNLDDSADANITFTFYPEEDGTAALTYDDTIAAGGTKTYFTPSTPPGVPSGFLGSAVVSSDKPVACSVNTQKQSSGTQSDPYRIGTSAGVATDIAAPTMYVPQVLKGLGGWNSYIAVQNTESSAVDVTVSFKDSTGAALPDAAQTASIPGQSTKVFYQDSNADIPSSFIGAATVSADDGASNLAVVVNFYNAGTGVSTAQLHSYNGFDAGASKLYVPRIVRNFYGYNGGFSIQNISTTDSATVRITFSFAGNDYVYNSPSIAPGAALPLYAPNMAELDPVDSLPEGQRFGSAVIEVLSGGPVVAIVNEDNRGGPGIPAERAGQGSSYNAISDGTQTGTVFFAQIARNAGGIFSGGFQVANTTDTSGTCDITYSGAAAATETGVPLPASGSIARYAPNVTGLPDGFNGGVTVVCTQDVVGISNLAVNTGSGRYGDSFTQANGLNQ